MGKDGVQIYRELRENESDLYLEIAKFSDPSFYLKNDQYEISDRLIYNKPMFAFEKNSLLPKEVPKRGAR